MSKRINEHILEKQKDINSDAYRGACVAVVENVLNYLDTFEGEFNIGYYPDMTTPHGIICECDDQGLTGFMARTVRNIVCICHELGWKFYVASLLSKCDLKNKELHNEIIYSLTENKHLNVTEKEIRDYIKGLFKRCEEKKENE